MRRDPSAPTGSFVLDASGPANLYRLTVKGRGVELDLWLSPDNLIRLRTTIQEVLDSTPSAEPTMAERRKAEIGRYELSRFGAIYRLEVATDQGTRDVFFSREKIIALARAITPHVRRPE